MSKHVFSYDESGKKIVKEKADPQKKAQKNERTRLYSTGDTFDSGNEMKGKWLDEVIREQLYGILKTKGDFAGLTSRDWVQHEKQKD